MWTTVSMHSESTALPTAPQPRPRLMKLTQCYDVILDCSTRAVSKYFWGGLGSNEVLDIVQDVFANIHEAGCKVDCLELPQGQFGLSNLVVLIMERSLQQPVHYNTTTLQHHYITTLLHYNTTTLQHHYITTPLHNNTTTLQQHHITPPLHYSSITTK